MPRLRSAPPTQQLAANAPKGRRALKEKTNTTRANAPLYKDDGDTEGLVKNSKPKRGRPKKVQQDSGELVMAGGLGVSDSADGLQPASNPPTTTDELVKCDEAPAPTAKLNRRPPRTVKKIAPSEAQSKVLQNLKQRMDATAHGQRAKQKPSTVLLTSDMAAPSSEPTSTKQSASRTASGAVERSEFSLSPSPPRPGKLSVTKASRTSITQPGSVLPLQNTPALENSLMALKNFKRRPRQPSMLQMVQQRTASARPSIANTAVETTAAESTSVFDLDLEADDEDDFVPEAEGTPFNARKTARGPSGVSSRPPSAQSKYTAIKENPLSKKRRSIDIETSMSSLGMLQAKRRKPMTTMELEESILPSQSTRVSATQSSSEHAATPRSQITSDVRVPNSPSTSTPPAESPLSRHRSAAKDVFTVPSTQWEEQEQERLTTNYDLPGSDDAALDGTMAEPLSSSPLRESGLGVDKLADPITQVSPAVAKPKPKRTRPISTAILQSLLPKKRQPLKPRHRKSEYDLESDSDEDAPLDAGHLEDDEDELGGRLQRQTKKASTKPSETASSKRGRPKKNANNAKQSSTALGHKSSIAPKKGPKTYGRAAASDKENDGYESPEEENDESSLPDVSISMQDATKSKELEEAKRKFAEIDDWDMDFETIATEDHRSSSQDWR